MRVRLDPDFADAFDQLISEALAEGVIEDIELVSGYRSTAEQKRLYLDWRAGKSRLPAAPPGSSYHEAGLAIDVSVRPAEALPSFGEFAERRGFRWGGRFGDEVHFDAGNDLSITEAIKQFRIHRLVEVE